MTHAYSMDSGTRLTLRRPLTHYAVVALLAQVVVSLIVALLLPVHFSSGGWSLFLGTFLYGLVYANCCGWLAWVVMPRVVAHRITQGTQLHRWTLLIVTLSAIGILGSLLAALVLAAIGVFPWLAYWERFWGGLRIALVVSLVTGILWFLFESMQYRVQFARSQARLAALESKVQPHFLFNTLNSIAALIPENPAAAERMTERLAALLRFSLDSRQGSLVRLEHELKVVIDYLEIEKARFGPRLNYTIDVPGEVMTRSVPRFSIQTLVENCLKYGGNVIRIVAREENGRLAIDVWDSGTGFSRDSIQPGHGLHNLRLRMALLWGLQSTLDVFQEHNGCSVRLTMPSRISE